MSDGAIDEGMVRRDLKGTNLEPSFSGVQSFMRRKYTKELAGVDIAVTGVPLDITVSNRPGTRFGPQAIRQATAQHAWGPIWPWRFDPFDTLAVTDYGDCLIDWGRPEDVVAQIEAHIDGILAQGVGTFVLGGDHFVTYCVLKSYAKTFGPIGLVQFDAHRDVEPDEGGRLDHGTMFNRAIAEGIVDPARTIQLGIRTCFNGEEEYGVKVVYADEVHDTPPDALAKMVLDRVGDGPTYLTFDIDFLDPATAPGTGTPVPGGFTSFQALSILRALKGLDVVGMDLVEVSPPFDHAEMTSNAAAMIAIEMFCLKAWSAGARATL